MRAIHAVRARIASADSALLCQPAGSKDPAREWETAVRLTGDDGFENPVKVETLTFGVGVWFVIEQPTPRQSGRVSGIEGAGAFPATVSVAGKAGQVDPADRAGPHRRDPARTEGHRVLTR